MTNLERLVKPEHTFLTDSNLMGFVRHFNEQPAAGVILKEVMAGFRVCRLTLSDINPEADRECVNKVRRFLEGGVRHIPKNDREKRELAWKLEQCKIALFPYSVARVDAMPDHDATRVFGLYGDVRDENTLKTMQEFVMRVAAIATHGTVPPENRVQKVSLNEFREGVSRHLFDVVKPATRIVLSVIDKEKEPNDAEVSYGLPWNRWSDLTEDRFFRYRRSDVAHVEWQDENNEWQKKPMRWVHVILTNDEDCLQNWSDPERAIVLRFPWDKFSFKPILPSETAVKKSMREAKGFESVNTMYRLRQDIADTKHRLAQAEDGQKVPHCVVCGDCNEDDGYDAELEMSPLYRDRAGGEYVRGLLCPQCRDVYCRGDCEYCGIQLTAFKTPHHWASVMPRGMQINSDLKSCLRCWYERVPEDAR